MKAYPVMQPNEYEKARMRYNLPTVQFAELLGVGWRQGFRYKTGKSKIPGPVAKLIRTAIRHKLDIRDIG